MNTGFSYSSFLRYDLGAGVEAFSTRRDSVLPYPVVTGHQVHGCEIALVSSPNTSRDELRGYDALITAQNGVAIGVRTADCVPILMHDAEAHVIAAVHAGWKGTVQRIAQKVVFKMQQTFGSKPENITAVLGPAIGPDSFQVGEEIVTYFKNQGFPLEKIWFFNEGKGESPMHHGHHVDLWKSNAWLLETCGIPPGNIHVEEVDTYTDPSFFSARREGVECGRIISAVKII